MYTGWIGCPRYYYAQLIALGVQLGSYSEAFFRFDDCAVDADVANKLKLLWPDVVWLLSSEDGTLLVPHKTSMDYVVYIEVSWPIDAASFVRLPCLIPMSYKRYSVIVHTSAYSPLSDASFTLKSYIRLLCAVTSLPLSISLLNTCTSAAVSSYLFNELQRLRTSVTTIETALVEAKYCVKCGCLKLSSHVCL